MSDHDAKNDALTVEKNNVIELADQSMVNPNVPKIYFNGFQILCSNSDLSIVLLNAGTPAAVLQCSFGTGKSLASKLGSLIDGVEEQSGFTFPSIEDVQSKLANT